VLFNALQVYSNLRHSGPFCWGVADAGKAQGAESMHAGRVEVTAHPGVRNLCTPFGLDVGNRLNKQLPRSGSVRTRQMRRLEICISPMKSGSAKQHLIRWYAVVTNTSTNKGAARKSTDDLCVFLGCRATRSNP
jgi:hypothetical protein